MRVLLIVAVVALVVAVGFRAAGPGGGGTAVRPDTGLTAAALDDDAVQSVLGELLLRVYGAFGQVEEGAIYDGLATAVSEGLLPELYLQRRAAQISEVSEGGVTEILSVDLIDMAVTSRDAGQYVVNAEWQVLGVLGHEDHRHERLNGYSAEVTIGAAAGEWRLVEFDLNRVRREEVPIFFGGFE